MNQTYKVYYTWRAKLLPVLLCLCLAVLAMLRYLKPHNFGLTLKLLSCLMLIAAVSTVRKYLSVLRGDPAFAIGSDGIWVGLLYDEVQWEDVISIRLYVSPEILVLEHQHLRPQVLAKYLPSRYVRKNVRWILTAKRVREPLLQIREELNRYFTVEVLQEAPDDIVDESRTL